MPRSRKGDDELENETLEAGEGDDVAEPAVDVAADEDEEGEEAEEGVPASAAGRASAARLLELLVEKKALALLAKKPGNELIEKVARVLESPAAVKARASRLSDVIVDSDDVDELFIDDETLIELLKRW
ncbi:hypothetical protein [Sandaracinus amylolyticus]|uniref:Uncharacterized protein n=1 Tax=Sandaracinus amylolyticus TaxID=927083 RepID=A0A0F6WAK4_9BACT|nr:hypothetical protein [Sandaracinus amylolyticus]AKF11565.1 hypothetical protein DB32_008714 [Sandaracinus amylolyticus]